VRFVALFSFFSFVSCTLPSHTRPRSSIFPHLAQPLVKTSSPTRLIQLENVRTTLHLPFLSASLLTIYITVDSYHNAQNSDKGSKSYGDTGRSGDVIGVILDLDSGKISFTKNGTDLGVAFSNCRSSETWTPAFSLRFAQRRPFSSLDLT
jgi:hypothetical protein